MDPWVECHVSLGRMSWILGANVMDPWAECHGSLRRFDGRKRPIYIEKGIVCGGDKHPLRCWTQTYLLFVYFTDDPGDQHPPWCWTQTYCWFLWLL